MREQYDVIVVGGGPSGTTCARALAARGAAVLVIDKKSPGWHKPCGGGIPDMMFAPFGVPKALGFSTPLVRVLDAERVTVINMTPSAFYQLAEAVREPSVRTFPASVRSMILAGEALDFLQVRRWFADRERCEGSAGPQLNNMYGPTEATVYSTRRELTPPVPGISRSRPAVSEAAASRRPKIQSLWTKPSNPHSSRRTSGPTDRRTSASMMRES